MKRRKGSRCGASGKIFSSGYRRSLSKIADNRALTPIFPASSFQTGKISRVADLISSRWAILREGGEEIRSRRSRNQISREEEARYVSTLRGGCLYQYNYKSMKNSTNRYGPLLLCDVNNISYLSLSMIVLLRAKFNALKVFARRRRWQKAKEARVARARARARSVVRMRKWNFKRGARHFSASVKQDL
jgi:hypothetical protein